MCGIVEANPEAVAYTVDNVSGEARIRVTCEGTIPLLPLERRGAAGQLWWKQPWDSGSRLLDCQKFICVRVGFYEGSNGSS